MSSPAHGKTAYPIRFPRFAPGIRAQEVRGGFWRGNWWAQRWQRRLEEMDLAGRLARAKHYAAAGQITELSLQESQVTAQVVGVRAEAYTVTITLRKPPKTAQNRILAHLKAEPMLLAQLLVNELPAAVEAIFRREGCDLFPGGQIGETAPDGTRRYDMTTTCSCPDYANPCKHTLAVLHLLGEEIARRPLTLLELRGLTEEALYGET